MFSIWRAPDESFYTVAGPLTPKDHEGLKDLGLEKVQDLKAKTKEEAQTEFVAWCKARQPDAKVEPMDFSVLRRSLN